MKRNITQQLRYFPSEYSHWPEKYIEGSNLVSKSWYKISINSYFFMYKQQGG